jgi:oligo-1,6-glucosidase
MQWDATPNAGFCEAGTKPWMRVMDDYETVNAAAQMGYESEADLSPWQWWRRALADRKRHKDVFVYGGFEDLSADDDEAVYAYARTSSSSSSNERWVVVLNFSGEERGWDLPPGYEVDFWAATTYGKGRAEGRAVEGRVGLRPWEGLLGKCRA